MRQNAPVACLDIMVQQRHRQWSAINGDSIRSLQNIASEQNWRLIVSSNSSIIKLDLASGKCETIYSSPGWIIHSSSQNNGEIVLLETESKTSSNGNDVKTFLVVLRNGDETIRIHLDNTPRRGLYLGGSPLLSNPEIIVYPDGDDVTLYERQSKRMHRLLTVPEGSYLFTTREIGDKLFLVLMDEAKDPEGSMMLVFDRGFPFRLVSAVRGITNIMTLPDNVLVQKKDTICSYDSSTNSFIEHVKGTLLATTGTKKLIYTDSFWRVEETGFHTLDLNVKKAEIAGTKHTKIAGDMSIDGCHGVSYPILSPDENYLLISDNTGSALVDSQYLLFDLRTGEKVGAFYEPFEGECYFNTVIDWQIERKNIQALHEK